MQASVVDIPCGEDAAFKQGLIFLPLPAPASSLSKTDVPLTHGDHFWLFEGENLRKLEKM